VCAVSRSHQRQDENGVDYVKKNAIAGRCFGTWEALEAHPDSCFSALASARTERLIGVSPVVP
jgi:hypothetical protein